MTRAVVLVVWAVLAGVVAVCVVLGIGPRRRVPTFGALVDRGTHRLVWRVLLILGWMWLGWHFFAR